MAWFFFPRIIASAMTIVSLIVLTRILGPSEFGRYNVSIVGGSIGYAFIFAWLSASIVRFNSTSEFLGKVVANAFDTGKKLALLLIPLIAVGYLIIPSLYSMAFVLGGMFCIAHAMQEIGLAGLRVQRNGPVYAIATIIRPIIGISLVLIIIHFHKGYEGAIIGMMFGAAISGMFALYKANKVSGLEPAEMVTLKSFFAFGQPLAVVAAGTMIIVLISQFILGSKIDLGAVGAFAAAQTLAMRSIAMPMAMLSRAFSASIFHAFEVESEDAANNDLNRYFSLLLLFSTPIAITLIFSNGTVSYLMFGKIYKATVSQQLPILAIAAFVTGVQGAYFSYAFKIHKKTLSQMFILIAMVILHACATLVAIHWFGAVGAAYAVLFSASMSCILYMYIGSLYSATRLQFDGLWKIAVAAIAQAIVANMADHVGSLAFGIILIIAGVFVFLIVLGVLRHEGFLYVLLKLQRITKKLRAIN